MAINVMNNLTYFIYFVLHILYEFSPGGGCHL